METFVFEVFLGLDFDGHDFVAPLQHEIDLGRAFFGGPVIEGVGLNGQELLEHILFGQGALELGKQPVAVQQGRGRQAAVRAQQAIDLSGR